MNMKIVAYLLLVQLALCVENVVQNKADVKDRESEDSQVIMQLISVDDANVEVEEDDQFPVLRILSSFLETNSQKLLPKSIQRTTNLAQVKSSSEDQSRLNDRKFVYPNADAVNFLAVSIKEVDPIYELRDLFGIKEVEGEEEEEDNFILNRSVQQIEVDAQQELKEDDDSSLAFGLSIGMLICML